MSQIGNRPCQLLQLFVCATPVEYALVKALVLQLKFSPNLGRGGGSTGTDASKRSSFGSGRRDRRTEGSGTGGLLRSVSWWGSAQHVLPKGSALLLFFRLHDRQRVRHLPCFLPSVLVLLPLSPFSATLRRLILWRLLLLLLLILVPFATYTVLTGRHFLGFLLTEQVFTLLCLFPSQTGNRTHTSNRKG